MLSRLTTFVALCALAAVPLNAFIIGTPAKPADGRGTDTCTTSVTPLITVSTSSSVSAEVTSLSMSISDTATYLSTTATFTPCTSTLETVTATGSAGEWAITGVAVVTPAPSLEGKNYVVGEKFVEEHQIGMAMASDRKYLVNVTSDDFGYFEFKCQFECGDNCLSWFVASEATNGQSVLSCAQYDALMDSSIFVAAAANQVGFGIAYNVGDLCPASAPKTISSASSISSTAAATSTCTSPGGTPVPVPVPVPTSAPGGTGWYVDDNFVKAHRFSYLVSNDFVSVNDFYEKCWGECAESGPIGLPFCNSFFIAYGIPDYANNWPHEGCCDDQWLCQLFNATLTPSLYKRAKTTGTWTNPQGSNNLC